MRLHKKHILGMVAVALIGVLAITHTPNIPFPTYPNPTITQEASSSALPITGLKCHSIIKESPLFVLPDPTCTPGALNTSVTQDNIQNTICMPGYTKTIRPPVSFTNSLKIEQMNGYGYTDSISNHEEDHLISLELGGSPTSPLNLWPEPGKSPNPKDSLENLLHKQVCSGQITLLQAQQSISQDWVSVYKANF